MPILMSSIRSTHVMAQRTSSQVVLISTHTLWCPPHTQKKGRKKFKTCIYPLFRCHLKVAMAEGDSELTKRCAVLVKEHWTEIRILELLRRNSGMVIKV